MPPGCPGPGLVWAPRAEFVFARCPPLPPRGSGAAEEQRTWTGLRGPDGSPGGDGDALRSASESSRPAAPSFFPAELKPCRPHSGAGLPDGHGPLAPVRGRLVMLPKVETEALGLARSHGDQGQMPENMQGKEALAARGSRGSPAPGSPRG